MGSKPTIKKSNEENVETKALLSTTKVFHKVPDDLFQVAIKQILNSNGNIGQGIQLIQLLKQCETINE